MTKDYQLTHTTESGEVYAVRHRFTSSWVFNGWDFYKNDNWCQYIPDVEFALDGVNVIVKTDAEAIKIGMALESLDNLAEAAFNHNHPELNP